MNFCSSARAVIAKTQGRSYRVTIFVDGLTRPEQATFTTRLRARGIARKKVRGVRDEQSNAGVRLADALCGLIQDAEEGELWAMATLAQLRQRRVVTPL